MDSYQLELNSILLQVRALATKQSKLSGFCIGNTRKTNENRPYYSPIRITDKFICGSVIVYAANQAKWIAKQVDGRVDYIFVDTEKKVASQSTNSITSNLSNDISNVEREVRESVKLSKVLTYKGNDMTVDSIENLIVQIVSTHPSGLGGKKCTIIGAGNVGAKLALKLVERGMEVTITRRDSVKLNALVIALNIIKPTETIAKVRGTTDNLEASQNADLLIGLTQGISAITAKMISVVNDGAFLLDAGKGCFAPDALDAAKTKNLPIYRADIRAGFEGHSMMAFCTEKIYAQGVGRSEINGVHIVAGGLLGYLNEVVVDSILNPSRVFGVANGFGDFVRNLSDQQSEYLEVIRNHITYKNTL